MTIGIEMKTIGLYESTRVWCIINDYEIWCLILQVRNLGKPVELASRYYEEGADEVPPISVIVEDRIYD